MEHFEECYSLSQKETTEGFMTLSIIDKILSGMVIGGFMN